MRHEEGFVERPKGIRLSCQCWRTDAAARANVVIVHGLGEHSGRYMNLVVPLATHGYDVWGYDHRGHGRSSGRRIHVNRWGEYREDLLAVLDRVMQAGPDKPIFLYGHSMGALVVLDFLLNYPQRVRGAIVSGAPIEPAIAGSAWRIAVARVLSAWCPRFRLDPNLDITALSRDPDVVRTYRSDPLVTGRVTVRWCTEILDAIVRVKTRASELSMPLLLLHGEADRLNLPVGSRFLCDAVARADLKLYPDGYHEPHNDPEHERVAEDVRRWLERQLGDAFCVPSRRGRTTDTTYEVANESK
jgi:alpha-beta hydrolase superfamily lysophospholipase